MGAEGGAEGGENTVRTPKKYVLGACGVIAGGPDTYNTNSYNVLCDIYKLKEYLLDFVNIVDANDEEETIDEPEWMMEMVSKIRHFIQALGSDFCFMDVKKRFVVDNEEYFADLVFFHRELK